MDPNKSIKVKNPVGPDISTLKFKPFQHQHYLIF